MSRTGIDFALTRTGITPHERLVLVSLCYKLTDRLGDYSITASVDSLAALLEMADSRVKACLAALELKGHVSKVVTRKLGKVKYKITIHVVNPYIEEQVLLAKDVAVQHRINLFEQLLAIYPIEENRDKAWKVFAALDPDEKLFFEMVNDIYGRISGGLPPLSGMQLSSYLERKLWVKRI